MAWGRVSGRAVSHNSSFYLFLLVPIVSGWGSVRLIRHLSRRKTPAGWIHCLAGNALVLLFFLSSFFVAAEAYYRFFYDSTDSFSYARTSQDWFHRHYKVNAAGFRDDVEYRPAVAPGRYRISFVGDSFLAGHGVNRVEDRFPNLIRQAHPEWEIHVLAKPGYDTKDELTALDEQLQAGYQLNEVVLVYNLNDLSDLLPEWNRAARLVALDQDRRGWLRRNSYLADMIYDHWRAAHDPYLKNYFDFVIDGYRGPVWEQQKQQLTSFRDMVQSHGGHLVVVTFPFLHGLGPNYRFQPVHEQLKQFWGELNVPYLDLLPVYSNLPPSTIVVNRFDAHPNEHANALAAQAVERFLVQQVGTNAAVQR